MAYISNNWLKLNLERDSPHYPILVEMKGQSTSWNDCVYYLRFTHSVTNPLGENQYKAVHLLQDEIEAILPDLLISIPEKSRIDILRDTIPNMSDEAKFGLIKLLLEDNED